MSWVLMQQTYTIAALPLILQAAKLPVSGPA
jgi:hypothetical protein